MENEINKALRQWLITRFKESWWTPNFDRMTSAMISHCNIRNCDDVKCAIESGKLEEVIDIHLNKMTALLKHSKRHSRLNDVCED
ncbi:hypothetical protein HWV00_20940 (plasmid) [Moritella sp. 24]|uniref:hypothetical protein n=1 Tax=Moritella sp. 24 TaxID=2746230 RepID=UPI001BABDDB1|nr:hypothetical protein [Moritella sp. 24]QUM78741.1 hypothetical protein HWV00_20940 [Moritella sp. 24]